MYLAITIFYVFVDIFIKAALLKILLLILLTVITILIGIQFFRPEILQNLPKWLFNSLNQMVERLRIFPFEFLLIIGIFYTYFLAIKDPMEVNRIDRINSTVLIGLAFVFSHLAEKAKHTGHHGFRSAWELIIKPLFHIKIINRQDSASYQKASQSNPDANGLLNLEQQKFISNNENSYSTTEVTLEDNFSLNSEWEKAQDIRWKEWLIEEMGRLSGNSNS